MNEAPTTTPHDWTQQPPLALAGIGYFAPLYEHAVLADRKAAFFMSAGGLMLTILGFFLARIERLIGAHSGFSWVFAAALITVALLVVTAGITAYIGFSRLLPPIPPSLAVFRDIAARTPEQYASDLRALTHEEAMIAILNYNRVVAGWALVKFRLVNRALAMLRIAIPLWMMVLLVLAVAG